MGVVDRGISVDYRYTDIRQVVRTSYMASYKGVGRLPVSG